MEKGIVKVPCGVNILGESGTFSLDSVDLGVCPVEVGVLGETAKVTRYFYNAN